MLKIWDVETGREVGAIPDQGPILAVALSPKGDLAVSAGADRTVNLWNNRCLPLATLGGHLGAVWSVAVSGDGRRVISSSEDYTARVWDRRRFGKAPAVLGPDVPNVIFKGVRTRGVAISRDGRWVVAACEDLTLKVLDLRRRKEKAALRLHQQQDAWGVGISADGRHVVAACTDHTLKVWDLERSQEVATLRGHTEDVYSVAVSADGRRAASTSEDHTVRLWDLQNMCQVAAFSADAAVWSCALAADGLTLVAGDDAGRVLFLRLEGTAR